MVGDAASGGVGIPAKGAGHGATAVDAGVEVLAYQQDRRQKGGPLRVPYHPQLIVVTKDAVAVTAIILVMPLGCHVVVGGLLRREHHGARLALKVIIVFRSVVIVVVVRSPVSDCVHVLVSGRLRAEFALAGVTRVGWHPVVERVHVLPARAPAVEAAVAGIAFV